MRYIASSTFGSYCSDDLGPKVVKQTFERLVLYKLSSKLKTDQAIQNFLQLPPVEERSHPVAKLGR